MDVELLHLLSEGVSINTKEVSCRGLNIVVPSQSQFDDDFLNQVDDVREERTF